MLRRNRCGYLLLLAGLTAAPWAFAKPIFVNLPDLVAGSDCICLARVEKVDRAKSPPAHHGPSGYPALDGAILTLTPLQTLRGPTLRSVRIQLGSGECNRLNIFEHRRYLFCLLRAPGQADPFHEAVCGESVMPIETLHGADRIRVFARGEWLPLSEAIRQIQSLSRAAGCTTVPVSRRVQQAMHEYAVAHPAKAVPSRRVPRKR